MEAEGAERSFFRGSLTEGDFVCEGKNGLLSRPGGASRLGILKLLAPFEVVANAAGDLRASCDATREGPGECI